VQLAGTPVADRDVLELARLARDVGFNYLAEKLETAYDCETRVLALTIDEREMIIGSIDDPPEALAELRGVLLQEHEWRRKEGLV
jgi:hypothetical protein